MVYYIPRTRNRDKSDRDNIKHIPHTSAWIVPVVMSTTLNSCLVSMLLGLKPEVNQTVSPELQARNINRLRCTPSMMRLWAAPSRVQVAFKTYTGLLPAYMHSCQEKVNADVREFAHPVTIPIADCIPFNYPSLCVTPKKDSAEAHQALLDLGGQFSVIRGKKVYAFKHPSTDTLKTIVKLDIDRTSQCADNMVNLSAYDSYRTILKVFSQFLKVHKYPAYLDPSHETYYEPVGEFEAEADVEVGKKRKRVEESPAAEKHQRLIGSRTHIIKSQSHKLVDGYLPDKPITGDEVIVRIKTIPTPALTPWVTSIDDLPSTWGLWAPYVSSLQYFDTDLVPRVLYKWFLGSLAKSRDGCLRAIEKIKSDWGNLGNTEVGKELTHLALFIDAVIVAQARIIPVFANKRYFGSFISGAGFRMSLNEAIFDPLPFTEVTALIAASDVHNAALKKILELLGLRDPQGDAPMTGLPDYLKDTTLTMFKLRSLCLASPVSEANKAIILEQGRLLDFHTTYWGTNPASLCRALSLITDFAEELPADIPVHPSKLFVTDRLETVWSGFGFSAPSFRPPSAKLIGLAESTYSVNFSTRDGVKTETRPFQFLHVAHLALDQAIADIKEVQKSGKVGLLTNPQRSADNQYRKLEKDGFISVVAALRKLASVERVSKGKVIAEVEKDDDALMMDDDDF
jgi:hypothetical protein